MSLVAVDIAGGCEGEGCLSERYLEYGGLRRRFAGLSRETSSACDRTEIHPLALAWNWAAEVVILSQKSNQICGAGAKQAHCGG